MPFAGMFGFQRMHFDCFHMFSLSFISLGFGLGELTVWLIAEERLCSFLSFIYKPFYTFFEARDADFLNIFKTSRALSRLAFRDIVFILRKM